MAETPIVDPGPFKRGTNALSFRYWLRPVHVMGKSQAVSSGRPYHPFFLPVRSGGGGGTSERIEAGGLEGLPSHTRATTLLRDTALKKARRLI